MGLLCGPTEEICSQGRVSRGCSIKCSVAIMCCKPRCSLKTFHRLSWRLRGTKMDLLSEEDSGRAQYRPFNGPV